MQFEGFAVDVEVIDVGEVTGALVLGLPDDDERWSMGGAHLAHRVVELVCVAHVGGDADRDAALSANRLHRGIDIGFGPCEYGHPATLCRKHFGDFESDSLAAADDQR